MPFNFLKYLLPTHYFVLKRQDGTTIYPIISSLSKEIINQLEPDANYSSKIAGEYDLSWQAIKKGYIGNTPTYSKFEKLPVIDEYRFVRKYFNAIWASYILLLRLVSFKNPFVEISAWYKTRNVKRSNYLNNPVTYANWQNFSSKIVEKNLWFR